MNDLLSQNNDACVFVTVFYGVLDLKSGLFRYCNGGHNLPRVIRDDGGVDELPGTDDVVLGVVPDHAYKDTSIDLAPGDALFLYTDGITEAQNGDYEEFGEARLDDALGRLAQEGASRMAQGVVEAVQQFAGDAPQSDDLTCIALRFKANA